jgi:hypothetical protein
MSFIVRLVGWFIILLAIFWIVSFGIAMETGQPVGAYVGEDFGTVTPPRAVENIGWGIVGLVVGAILVGFASLVENASKSRRVLEKMLEIGSQE